MLTVRYTSKRYPKSSGSFSSARFILATFAFEEYEANLAQLRANRQAHGEDRRNGPAREGPALREATRDLWTLWQSDDGALP